LFWNLCFVLFFIYACWRWDIHVLWCSFCYICCIGNTSTDILIKDKTKFFFVFGKAFSLIAMMKERCISIVFQSVKSKVIVTL
jgi:hypothetical protein